MIQISLPQNSNLEIFTITALSDIYGWSVVCHREVVGVSSVSA